MGQSGEGTLTQGSSLPPIKKNDGKYVLLALLLLLAAGGLWLFVKSEDSEPPAEVATPAPEPPPREQFAPQIEIPEEPTEAKRAESKDEPERQPSEPTWKPPSEWDCRGTLQASQIRDVINGPPRKQVQTCYERGLKDNNLLQGTMKVLLTIGSSGEVRAVSISGSLDDPQVYTCVKRVAKSWKFPKPQGGCVRTEVPFQMTPKL
ncbi:MAG: AgmX/PglI C-terminal domain-containing protein [Myxococcales bacterium]